MCQPAVSPAPRPTTVPTIPIMEALVMLRARRPLGLLAPARIGHRGARGWGDRGRGGRALGAGEWRGRARARCGQRGSRARGAWGGGGGGGGGRRRTVVAGVGADACNLRRRRDDEAARDPVGGRVDDERPPRDGHVVHQAVAAHREVDLGDAVGVARVRVAVPRVGVAREVVPLHAGVGAAARAGVHVPAGGRRRRQPGQVAVDVQAAHARLHDERAADVRVSGGDS